MDSSLTRGRSLGNEDWSNVLIEALPYFRQWCGKTVVIKYGGNAMLNDVLKSAVVEDIVLLHTIGVHVVLVHGGGPEINAMLKRVNIESRFVDGLRVTDKDTIEIVLMVLAGKLNKDIVSRLLSRGGAAVGLSGVDSGLLVAKKLRHTKVLGSDSASGFGAPPSDKDSLVDLGFVGEVTQVNPKILTDLLEKSFIPVVSTVAIGESYEEEAPSFFDVTKDPAASASSLKDKSSDPTPLSFFNINADTAAAKIACALKAEKFVQLTNVPGVLTDINDPNTLIARIPASNVPHLIDQGVISGGMIPKVECCMTALRGGVRRTHIIDGRVPHSLLIEMFSDRGIGTMIY